MRRSLVLAAVLGTACSAVEERGACAVATDCPAGQYCARTPDGSVCWADAEPPVVTSVAATCPADGCRRDSILHVTAAVTDATSEVLDASVALDLAGGPAVAMARNGAQWEADVDLRQFPFEHFQRNVVATVTARDGARNASAGKGAAAVSVTRLRWIYDAGVPMTAPAVMDDGTVVVGLSASADQLLAVRPDGTKAWSLTVGGTSFVTAAPAIGESAIWVGSEDFNLYAAESDGSALKSGVGVFLGGPIKGSLAVLPAGGNEWAFATATSGDGVGFIGVSSAAPSENNVTSVAAQEGFTAGPVIGPDGLAHAPASTPTNSAALRSYSLNTSPAVLTATHNAPVIGKRSSAPLAMDGLAVLSASEESPPVLNRIVPGPTPALEKVGELSGIVGDSAVAIATSDILVGDESGRLHRLSATGAVWAPAVALGAPVRAPMVLIGTDTHFIVPTTGGKIHAVADDGHIKWEGVLPSANGLRAGNIFTPAPQSETAVMSLAYFTSANGRLYAVIVDGQLDTSAPWPKAFHDPKNTNRAGPQP